MAGFLRDAITIIKGREFELPLAWYSTFVAEGDPGNVLKVLDGYSFVCDFKYTVNGVPIFTLFSATDTSPPVVDGLVVNEAGELVLTVSPDKSQLVAVDVGDNKNDFPFTTVYFEVKYISPEGVAGNLVMGRANVYERITTSDE